MSIPYFAFSRSRMACYEPNPGELARKILDEITNATLERDPLRGLERDARSRSLALHSSQLLGLLLNWLYCFAGNCNA